MGAYVRRRLLQAALTVFGVMLLTFVLFRVIAGDVSAQYLGPRATEQDRQRWLAQRGLTKPVFVDLHHAPWSKAFWDSQFVNHLVDSVTFGGRSFRTHERLRDIIAKRASYSLAISVPALAAGWVAAMVISLFVAYYRDTWLDRTGVFLSVLGMCVPFLAYMILGQWLVLKILPSAAWGLRHTTNIYVPVAIAVIASLGHNVRFYRTIILDEVRRDYVRTARAKGAPLPNILFGHVLKNCMLPILTNLVTAVPFLILGSLLLETFFGIPGLGEQMISSITNRDVPIIAGLTFLTAVIYVLGYLVTDILYAVFDPRVRLQ